MRSLVLLVLLAAAEPATACDGTVSLRWPPDQPIVQVSLAGLRATGPIDAARQLQTRLSSGFREPIRAAWDSALGRFKIMRDQAGIQLLLTGDPTTDWTTFGFTRDALDSNEFGMVWIADAPPLPAADQGNAVLAAKAGADVLLSWDPGAAASWHLFRDESKDAIGQTRHDGDLLVAQCRDFGAVAHPAPLFYALRGVSCAGVEGP